MMKKYERSEESEEVYISSNCVYVVTFCSENRDGDEMIFSELQHFSSLFDSRCGAL